MSPVPRRPWTDAERALARALARCTFGWAGRNARRFAEQMGAAADRPDDPGVTEKQAACLRRLVSAFRRQILPASIPEESRYLLTESAAARLRRRTSYVLTEEGKARPVQTSAIAVVPSAPAPAPVEPAKPETLPLFGDRAP